MQSTISQNRLKLNFSNIFHNLKNGSEVAKVLKILFGIKDELNMNKKYHKVQKTMTPGLTISEWSRYGQKKKTHFREKLFGSFFRSPQKFCNAPLLGY